eukprot:349972-Pyramimonas_sp.AAC.1
MKATFTASPARPDALSLSEGFVYCLARPTGVLAHHILKVTFNVPPAPLNAPSLSEGFTAGAVDPERRRRRPRPWDRQETA